MEHHGRTILAKNLRELRDAFGMTQEDVAGEAELDRSYVSALETCKYAATVDVLDKIASVFRLTIDELLRVDIAKSAKLRRRK
jgi:transcriptional regulator with XRE-family HTH domain